MLFNRRTIVAAVVLSLVAVGPGATTSSAQTSDPVRVIHITLDSLHPSEIGPDTPNLQVLKDTGTWYEEARAVMASETLPNHVAMATGTYPGRNNIPGNDGRVSPGDTEGADPDLGIYGLRTARSFVEAIEATCPDLRTVTVLSKEYVWRTFSEDPADSTFDQPTFNIPVSGHAPEASTVPYIINEIQGDGFDFLFANLGDIDRSGHIDVSGPGVVPAARRTAIQQADTFIASIVQALQQQNMWDSTVMVISSDHSMDYSVPADPSTRVDVEDALESDPRTQGRFLVSENGGAGMVYLLDSSANDDDQVLKDAREILAALPGMGEALYRQPNSLEPGNDLATVHPAWNLHQTDRAGDIFVYAADGHVIGSQSSNPLPGNHGHVETRHITSLVSGGWDGLVAQSVAASNPSAIDPADDTEVLTEQAEQVDFAPTFGWLMGVPDPGITIDKSAAQWQGRVLQESFSRQPGPACAVPAGSTGTPTTGSGATAGAQQTPSGTLATTGSDRSEAIAGAAIAGAAAGLVLVLRRRFAT